MKDERHFWIQLLLMIEIASIIYALRQMSKREKEWNRDG